MDQCLQFVTKFIEAEVQNEASQRVVDEFLHQMELLFSDLPIPMGYSVKLVRQFGVLVAKLMQLVFEGGRRLLRSLFGL